MANVFLSWSKPRSLKAARAFSTFANMVINAADPFISEEIDKGKVWDREISQAIQACTCGVAFLTPENLSSPWLLYEAGAIAHSFTEARCCTFLIDLKPSDVQQPLARFQATLPTEEDLLRLMKSINSYISGNRSERQIGDAFSKFWPDFKGHLENLGTSEEKTLGRSDRELLEEILLNSRRIGSSWEAKYPVLQNTIGVQVSDRIVEYCDQDSPVWFKVGEIIRILLTARVDSANLGDVIRHLLREFKTDWMNESQLKRFDELKKSLLEQVA